jgi:hypothetical protein
MAAMTPHRAHAFVLAAALSLATLACGPSIDAAAKADVDRRIALLAPSETAFPATPTFAPRPLAVGQWTQTKMVDDKGQPSLMTLKVVGAQGDAFWVENVHESYTGKTVTKLLLFFGDRSNPATMEIRQVKTKDKNGQVNQFDGPMISLMKSMWQGTLSTLTVTWQGQPQEDAKVIAGTFAGCYKARTDAAVGPFHAAATSWSHPAVPINGLVKSVGIDKPNTIELVAFGESGATSEIP